MEPYVILGACAPDLAQQALEVERGVGVLLPCNVVVSGDAEGSRVQVLEPQTMAFLTGRGSCSPWPTRRDTVWMPPCWHCEPGGDPTGRDPVAGPDGKQFDHDRVDQAVALGTVEEWTIASPTPMDHPFHLHVWPMQIVAKSGRPVGGVHRQDDVNVPARSEITVRVAFEQFGGRTVFHCHILDHEDLGMMGVVEAR